MKKISFFCLMLISTTQFLHAQTTWDEYNYCTSGYRDVLTKGLDPKVGYTVKEVYQKMFTFGDKENTTVWVKSLTRKASNKVAAYIVVYQLRDKANDQVYYCVPHPNSSSDILSQYLNSISGGYIDAKSIYRLQSLLYAVSMAVKW